jgi:hypothetical protein
MHSLDFSLLHMKIFNCEQLKSSAWSHDGGLPTSLSPFNCLRKKPEMSLWFQGHYYYQNRALLHFKGVMTTTCHRESDSCNWTNQPWQMKYFQNSLKVLLLSLWPSLDPKCDHLFLPALTPVHPHALQGLWPGTVGDIRVSNKKKRGSAWVSAYLTTYVRHEYKQRVHSSGMLSELRTEVWFCHFISTSSLLFPPAPSTAAPCHEPSRLCPISCLSLISHGAEPS